MYKLYYFNQYDKIPDDFIEKEMMDMPNERREKAERFRNKIDRLNNVITWVMLKYAIKETFGITDFHISYDIYGKPYLTDYNNVYFNISHCVQGCIVVVSDGKVGVDIQEIRDFSHSVAEKVCSEAELECLDLSSDKKRLFTKMWVIKESYVKMTGEGITNGLKNIDTTKINENIQVWEAGNCFVAVCSSLKNC
jgi:4'-phosphopantetheinyl transferase